MICSYEIVWLRFTARRAESGSAGIILSIIILSKPLL